MSEEAAIEDLESIEDSNKNYKGQEDFNNA